MYQPRTRQGPARQVPVPPPRTRSSSRIVRKRTASPPPRGAPRLQMPRIGFTSKPATHQRPACWKQVKRVAYAPPATARAVTPPYALRVPVVVPRLSAHRAPERPVSMFGISSEHVRHPLECHPNPAHTVNTVTSPFRRTRAAPLVVTVSSPSGTMHPRVVTSVSERHTPLDPPRAIQWSSRLCPRDILLSIHRERFSGLHVSNIARNAHCAIGPLYS